MLSREQEKGNRKKGEVGVQYTLQGHIPNGPISSYVPHLLKVPTSSLQQTPLEDLSVKP